MSKIFETWKARIDSGVFEKSECQAWAHKVVRLARGFEPRGHRTNLTEGEAADLMAYVSGGSSVRLTDEHTAAGINYLRRYGAKLSPRYAGSDFPTERVSEDGDFSHFEYRFESCSDPFDDRINIPIWYVVFGNGDELAYYRASWQMGGESSWWWVNGPTPTLRPATDDEQLAYLDGSRTFEGSEETDHGLLVRDEVIS